MSLLSTVPKVIVIAMQVALAALVILATVPIALGGVHVNVTEPAEITYDDYAVRVTMAADVDTDLYFDITGFRYNVYVSSGGRTFLAGGEDIGTVKNTNIRISAEIPFAVLAMMMLCGTPDDPDLTVSADLRGSTLGGMISASARVDAVVADIGNIIVTVNEDMSELHAGLTVDADIGSIADDIFGHGTVIVKIGDVTITVAPGIYTDGSYTVVVTVTCSSGPIIEALEKALENASEDGVTVYYDGTEYKLTEEDVKEIIEILKMLYGRYHP